LGGWPAGTPLRFFSAGKNLAGFLFLLAHARKINVLFAGLSKRGRLSAGWDAGWSRPEASRNLKVGNGRDKSNRRDKQ
jgi:hypothetical protein